MGWVEQGVTYQKVLIQVTEGVGIHAGVDEHVCEFFRERRGSGGDV
jgi:hypothetical protein